MSAGTARHYQTLDHWRGFAALWVMSFHSFAPWLAKRPDLLPRPLCLAVFNGWLGVHVFFVISGYCIAARLAADYRRGAGAIGFWRDRLWRIFPPYWAAVLLLAGVAWLASHFNGGRPDWPTRPGDWLGTIPALEPWLNRPSYLLVAWTITYELGFYVIAGLLFAIARATRRPIVAFLLVTALALAGLTPATAYAPVLGLWTHFALGIAVWSILELRQSLAERLVAASIVFGGLAGAAFVIPGLSLIPLVVACTTAWLFVVLREYDSAIARLRALRWLGAIGGFSYSLYLTHPPVVGRFRNLFDRWWPVDRPGAVWVPIAGAVLAVAVAWIFHRLVERPSERWRRAYDRRMSLLPVKCAEPVKT